MGTSIKQHTITWKVAQVSVDKLRVMSEMPLCEVREVLGLGGYRL